MHIQLIAFTLKQPEARVMEICLLLKDLHGDQLEMTVFVRCVVY